jgi:hypothetical protein
MLRFSERDRELVVASGIDLLVLDGLPDQMRRDPEEVSVDSTNWGGGEQLGHVRVTYGDADNPPTLSIYVSSARFLREVRAQFPPGDPLHDDVLVSGARRMFAAFSLRLPERDPASRTGSITPERMNEQYERLVPTPAQIVVDRRPVPAKSMTYGEHRIWWSSSATPTSGVTVYAWGWPHEPALRTI